MEPDPFNSAWETVESSMQNKIARTGETYVATDAFVATGLSITSTGWMGHGLSEGAGLDSVKEMWRTGKVMGVMEHFVWIPFKNAHL